MIDERYLVGSSRGLNVVLSWQLPSETEVNHENPQAG
jgi:hypothetical protein